MALIDMDFALGGGGGNVTPVIGGYCSSMTGTGVKGYTYYNLENSSLASYSNSKITINQKGRYRIGFFIRDTGAYSQTLVMGSKSETVTSTAYYTFTENLNVGDEIYLNRTNSSGSTSFSLDVDLLS